MKKDDLKTEFTEFSAHFDPGICEEIRDYVTNELLLQSRYIFIERVQGIQFGYCTHCKDKYITITNDLKHNDKVICSKCQSNCTVKDSWRGRKYMSDQAYFVYYEKSLTNKESITARGFFVKRDYSGDYSNVETTYSTRAMYLFESGKSQMYCPTYWSSEGWYKYNMHSLYSEYSRWAIVDCPHKSISEAVKGTPFQYSTWEQYPCRDMIRFFEIYSQYPCIEYLTKMGMRYFVNAKLYGGRTYGAINWRGKRIDQVLKLTKQQIREIKDSQIELHPLTIRLQQIVGKENSNIPLLELQEIATKYNHCFENIKRVIKYTTLRRSIAYANKQLNKDENKVQFRGPEEVFISWKDYISDCLKLEMDLTQTSVLFPKNLFDAHQKTIAQIKYQGDALLNAQILKRVESLKKYCFTHGDLFIRPAKSSDELIEEGKALKHCVGGYSKDYGNGKTSIFVIRKISEPDRPFFTMEVKSGRIVQTQGLKHISPFGEVKEFVDRFKAERLDKKPKKIKSKTSELKEVAV